MPGPGRDTLAGVGGVGGLFERLFAPRVLRRLYDDELKRLDRYARTLPPAEPNPADGHQRANASGRRQRPSQVASRGLGLPRRGSVRAVVAAGQNRSAHPSWTTDRTFPAGSVNHAINRP